MDRQQIWNKQESKELLQLYYFREFFSLAEFIAFYSHHISTFAPQTGKYGGFIGIIKKELFMELHNIILFIHNGDLLH